jgi:hypothetical protein
LIDDVFIYNSTIDVNQIVDHMNQTRKNTSFTSPPIVARVPTTKRNNNIFTTTTTSAAAVDSANLKLITVLLPIAVVALLIIAIVIGATVFVVYRKKRNPLFLQSQRSVRRHTQADGVDGQAMKPMAVVYDEAPPLQPASQKQQGVYGETRHAERELFLFLS